jgi:hypothetical protein
LKEDASTETFRYYELTQWSVDWAASGTSGACTIDAPAVHYESPDDVMNGYLILDLATDTYTVWFANPIRSAPAVQTCPPEGPMATQWGVRIGGQTDYLPLDLTTGSIDGQWNGPPGDSDDIIWNYKLTPDEQPSS